MLRQRMADGAVIGTFVKLPRPEVIAILALAGFDFAICDLEHSQITAAECRDVLQAARAEGLPVVVRVPALDRGLINTVLEAGAAGIQLPRTVTAADSRALADLMRYPPAGTRSMSQAQPAARYGAEPLTAYIERANEEALLVGQFETADLADELDDAVAPLDVAFIGSLDLSIAAGRPGHPEAPEVAELVERVAAAAKRTGRHMGLFASNTEAARTALNAGYRYIAVSADLSLLRKASDSLIAELRAS
jgi:2-keto-3-deoxy-L-rhamnonate aldolase RhmA